MKKLILALLLLPCVADAQTWSISLSGGASIISKPNQTPPAYSESKIRPGGVGMMSIAYRFSEDFHIGVDIAAVNLVRMGDVGSLIGTYHDVRLYIGKLAFIITPSLSYHLRDFYFGPQFGYFVTSGGNDAIDATSPLKPTYYFKDVRGFVAGAHLGFAHDLTKRLSVFGELRGNYLNGNQMALGVSVYGFNMFQYQVLAGLSYEY